jgi:hypothetical protein
MQLPHLTSTMRDIAKRQQWTERDIARLALSFMARHGELEDFESYLLRAAQHEQTDG